MKQIFFILTLVAFLGACSGGDSKDGGKEYTTKDFAGTWKIVDAQGDRVKPLTDCDNQTEWNFTEEEVEPLQDGTRVMQLSVTAPSSCEFYDFEAKWTVNGGKLFMSTTRTGGVGGNSFAGLFEIKEKTDKKFTVEIKGRTMTFEKK